MHETTASAVKGAGAKLLPFRFPGQYQDSEDELYNNIYYNWNRWYMPGLGRYNRADPLLSDIDISRNFGLPNQAMLALFNFSNTYAYPLNPLNSIDPEALAYYPHLTPPPIRKPSHCSASECNYYDLRCAETDCNYYCNYGAKYCWAFGQVDQWIWTQCVRSCLIESDRTQCSKLKDECNKPDCDKIAKCNWKSHYNCYSKCSASWAQRNSNYVIQ